jgi:hypothetical protein
LPHSISLENLNEFIWGHALFSFLRRADAPTASVVDVGWVIDPEWEATFIWDAPHKLPRPEARTNHAKGVSVCPAINDHEARLVEVTSPIDIHLRLGRDQKDGPALVAIDGDMSSVRPQYLNKLLMLVPPAEWRHPRRPMIQVMTPYLFVADEPVFVTMLPAFYHYPDRPLPGLTLGGRFPIDIWPRKLVWAFEWYDTSNDILINRGDPWFYVAFETQDPSRRTRLVEAEMTKDLREYTNGIRSVTYYVSRTYSLFGTAKERRPKKLLTPKTR